MSVDGNLKIHIDLKTISEKLAEDAGSKDTMTYDSKTNSYYINNITEDILKDAGFDFLVRDSYGKPIYKYEDILVSLSTSPANGIVTVYKEWKDSYLDYPYKKEV